MKRIFLKNEILRDVQDSLKALSAKNKVFLLDVFFPISCLGCGTKQEWFCEKCISKICFKKIEQACPVCEKSLVPDGRTCHCCRKKSRLDGMFVCASYKDKLVSKLIHLFKYKFISDLHEPLGKIATEKLLFSSLYLPDIIVAVPLYKARLRWRGFNQSELLAEYISKNLAPGLEIPLLKNVLRRNRNTGSQMKIKDHNERNRNVSGAFSVSGDCAFEEKSVLLVDDVATTGSTLFECANVLKKAGAKEVLAIVIARQGYK